MVKYFVSMAFVFCSLCISAQIPIQFIEQAGSFRAVQVMKNNLVWVSGAKGKLLKSTDGGKHFVNTCPSQYQNYDFRGIAFASKSYGFAMSAGDGAEGKAFVLCTLNGGKSWEKAYELNQKGIFFDAIKIKNQQVFLLSDPVDKHPFFLKFAKNKWKRCDINVELNENESSFAASNSCVQVYRRMISFNTQNRIFISSNKGKTWDVRITPFTKGQTFGMFGHKILTKKHWLVFGGDYKDHLKQSLNFAETFDGGLTWQNQESKSGLTEDVFSKNTIQVRVTDHGVYINNISVDSTVYHAIDCRNNKCVLVGGSGKIGLINLTNK